MANNQRRMNALLAAQGIINKATNDNMEKGIYTTEQKRAEQMYVAEQEKLARQKAIYNPYPDAQVDGLLERTAKGFAGGITRGVGELVEGVINLNPYESGSPNSLSPIETEYAKKVEQVEKDRLDVKTLQQKLENDGFSREEIADKVSSAIKSYSGARFPLQGDDYKIGQQEVRVNPLKGAANLIESLIPDTETDTGDPYADAINTTPFQKALELLDKGSKGLVSLANMTGDGFKSGMTVNESIQKQKDSRLKRSQFDKDYIASGLKEMASGDFPLTAMLTGKSRPDLVIDKNIVGSAANELYEADYIDSRKKNNASSWHELGTAIGTYVEDPSKIGATVGAVAGYALPFVGGAMMAGDVASVNFDMKQRMAEKRGTNYLDKADKDRIIQGTGMTAVAMKVGLDQVKGFARGGGVGKTIVDKLFDKVGGKTAAVLRPVAGILANGTAEGLQEVTELLTEKWGTYDDATKAELAQSFVDGVVGGGGMSAAGAAIKGAPEVARFATDVVNDRVRTDVTATEEESFDINNKKYDPSRIINRAASSIPSGEVNSIAPLQEAKDTATRARNVAVAEFQKVEAAAQIVTEIESIEQSLLSNQLSPKNEAEAIETRKQLKAELEETGLTPESIEVKMATMGKALDKADKAYADVISKLEEKRVANNLEEFSTEEVSTDGSSPKKNSIPKVDKSILMPSSANFNPVTGINDIGTKLSAVQSETDIDATVAEVNQGLVEARQELDQANVARGEMKALDTEIEKVATAFNNLEKNARGYSPEVLAEKQQVLEDKSEALMTQREALEAGIKALPKDAEAKYTQALKAAKKLTQRAEQLKTQRAAAIAKLEKTKASIEDEVWLGTASESQLEALAEIEIELEAYRTGSKEANLTKAQKAKRIKQKELKAKNIESRIIKFNKLNGELKEISDAINKLKARAAASKSPTVRKQLETQIERLREKGNVIVTKLSGYNKDSLIKDRIKNSEELDTLKGIKRKKPVVESKAVVARKDALEKAKATYEKFMAEDAGDIAINAAKENVEALEEELEATLEAEGKTVKEGQIVEQTPSLMTRVKKFLNSPAANAMTPEKKEGILELARQLSDLVVQENALKTSNNVHQQITGKGNEDYQGLETYEINIAEAIANNDMASFNRHAGRLQAFMKSHSSKAKAGVEAQTIADETGVEQVVYRISENSQEWGFKPLDTLGKLGITFKLRKSGALRIGTRSAGLVKQIAKEAVLIQNTLQVLRDLGTEIQNPTVASRIISTRGTVEDVAEPIQVEEDFFNQDVSDGNTAPRTQGSIQEDKRGFTEEDVNTLGVFADYSTIGAFVLPTNKISVANTQINRSPQPNNAQVTPLNQGDVKYIVYEFDEETSTPKKSEQLRAWKDALATKVSKKTGKGMQITDPEIKEYERIAAASNKSIAFGFGDVNVQDKSDWATRFVDKFGDSNNVSTYHGREYEASDVVAYIPDLANDSVEIAKARKAELDAAIEAGATIMLPSIKYTNNPKVAQAHAYLAARGYESELKPMPNINATDAKTAFYTPTERTKESDPIQAAQGITAPAKKPQASTTPSTPTGDADTGMSLLLNESEDTRVPVNFDDIEGMLSDNDPSDFYNQVFEEDEEGGIDAIDPNDNDSNDNVPPLPAPPVTPTPPVGQAPVSTEKFSQSNNPNKKHNSIINGELYANQDANIVVENALFENEWKATPMIAVNLEYREEAGKLSLNSKELKQQDMPLNSEGNIFSKYLANKDTAKIIELMGVDQAKLIGSQSGQLDAFIRLVNKMAINADRVLKDPGKINNLSNNGFYKHLVTRDTQGNYIVEESVVVAAALGVFQFIQTNGRNSYADERAIRSVHGIDKYAYISSAGKMHMSKKGTHRGLLYQEIGSIGVRALGLSIGDDANVRLKQEIEASLGAFAYHLVNHDNATNKFFTETKMTHREQLKMIVASLDFADAKKHMKELDKKVNGNNPFEEALGNARNKETLYSIIDSLRGEYYDRGITLTRASIDNVWDNSIKQSLTIYNPEVLDIIKASEKTIAEPDLLDTLFKTETSKQAPLDVAIEEFSQETSKKTDTYVPENTADALTNVAKQEWIIQKERADSVLKMFEHNPDALYRLMGVKSNEELANVHEVIRDELMMDNNIKRDLIKQQVAWLATKRDEKGNYSSFYHVPVSWVNQRVGYESTLFNAQTDLFARMLSGMKDWETIVDYNEDLYITDPQVITNTDGTFKEVENITVTTKGLFHLALAENMEDVGKVFGHKFASMGYDKDAKTPDKVKPDDYLPAFVEYLENSVVVKDAVLAINKLMDNKNLNQTDEDAIARAIKEFGMAELGYGALFEYARYKKAEANDEVFTTSIGAQSDGITNGPMITKFLLAAADAETRMMGGIITAEDAGQFSNFYDTKAAGRQDMYQTAGTGMEKTLAAYIPDDSALKKVLDTMDNIDKDFGSRSWAKKLLTPFNYGAGVASLKRAISNGFLDKFLSDYYAMYGMTQEERVVEGKRLNQLITEMVAHHNSIFTHQTITNANYEVEVQKLVYLTNANKKKLDSYIDPTLPTQELINILISRAPDWVKKKKGEDVQINAISEFILRKKARNPGIDINKEGLLVSERNYKKDLSNQVQQIISDLVAVSYGTASTKYLEGAEREVIVARDSLNEMANDAFDNTVILENIFIDELVPDSQIDLVKHNINSLESLTYLEKIEYKELSMTVKQAEAITLKLKPYKAAVASGMSNLNRDSEGNRLKSSSAGINVETSTTKTTMSQEIQFNNIKTAAKPTGGTAKQVFGFTFRSKKAPGVSALALIIQSIDASVTIQTLGKMEGMNMHDANMFGINRFKEGVNIQNRAFHDSVIKYHLSQEVLKAYIKPLYGLKAALKDPSISEASKELIRAKLKSEEASIIEFASKIDVAYDRDMRKLELAAQDAIIHQYGGVEGQFYLEKEDYIAIANEQKKLEASHKEELKALRKVVSTEDMKEARESNLSTITKLSNNNKAFIFQDIVKSNNININDLVNYMSGVVNKENTLLQDLSSLKDVMLKDVKVKTRKGVIKTGGLDGSGNPVFRDVVFSKFSNTLLVNEDNFDNLSSTDILREVMVASLHHNLKSIKNGSMKDKALVGEYRAMKLLADNMQRFTRAASMSKADGTLNLDQVSLLAETFRGREGNVEFLMTQVLYGSEDVKNALRAVPNYTGVTAQTTNSIAPDKSIFDSILIFIKSLILGMLDTNYEDFRAGSMYDLLAGSANVISKQTIANRQSNTIAGMVNESMSVGNNSTYKQEFELEYSLPNGERVVLNNYDTRFQLEMYKAKALNKGEPLKAGTVLALMENTLNQGIDSSTVEGQVFVDTLLPVVTLLRKALPKNTTVTIIDGISDIEGKDFPLDVMEKLEQSAYNGQAVMYNDDKTNHVFMISPNASSNPNTKLSDLVHELAHVFTSIALELNPDAKVKLVSLRNRLAKNMTSNVNSDIEYALKGDSKGNVDEFVAQVFSKSSVRQHLAEHEGKNRREGAANKEFFKEISSVLSADNQGALEEFAKLFSQFRSVITEENYDPETEPSEVKDKPEKWNERTIRINKGLNDIGIMQSSIDLANQFNGFDTGVLNKVARGNVDFMILKAIEYAKSKVGDFGLDTQSGEKKTIMDNNMNYLLVSIDGRDLTVKDAFVEYITEYMGNKANELSTLNIQEDADVMIAIVAGIDTVRASNHGKLFNSNSSTNQRVNQAEVYHPRQIANFLGKHSIRDNSYLKSIIETIVDPLVDKIDPALVRGYDYEKVWHDALISGEAVYASRAIDAGFDLDDQQGYVLEVIEVGLANSIDTLTNTAIYRQLEKAYKQAKKELTVESFYEGDWNETTQEERDIATAKYNLVFSPAVGAADGKSDYLTNFAALTIVSPEMQRVLGFSATRDFKEQDIYQKSVSLVTRAVEYMEEQSTDTYSGDTISNRVRDLSQELAGVYYKNQDKVVEAERDLFSRTENTLGLLSEKAMSAAHSAGVMVANIPLFRDTVGGKLTQQVLDGKLGQFDKFANHFMDSISPSIPLNDMRESFNELTGELSQEAHRDVLDGFYAAKAIEKGRGEMIETVAKSINESFSKANEKLDAKDSKAITNTLLRTDLQALLGTMDFNEIITLIKDPKELNKAIKEAEIKVLSDKHGNEFIARAKNLGNYMIRRQATDPLLAKNALAIVERVGITEANKDYSKETLANVDQLVSLYALRNTKKDDRSRLTAVLDREADNTNSINGLEHTLRSHQQMAKEAQQLFAENPYSVNKGYLPNLTNPTKGFEVVAQKDVTMYEELGYKVAANLNQSSLLDVSDGRVLMTISNTGKQRYVSGALSIEDGMKAGTVVISKFDIGFNKIHNKALAQFKQSVRGSHKDQEMKQEGGTLIPSYDSEGKVISYSYEMSGAGLDSHLERNNNHATLLGQYKGSNISKELYPSSNKKLIDALITKHNEANEFDKRKFVSIGPKSLNKRAREYWHSLPIETQLYIKDQNGTSEIMIRNDELNLLLGFRKFNPHSVFDKDIFERNLLEATYAALFEFPFRGKAKLRHNQMLGLWLDLIKTMKDFIVIRNFKVLWGNIKSNIAFLMLNQSDPKNAIKDIKDALISSLKYQKDMQKLNRLKHEMSIGLGTPKMVSEFAELRDAIARNPLTEFIGRGMMPMIVNDVSFQKGEVEYDTAFEMIKRKTVGKLPEKAQKGIDILLASPGTPIYSFLSNATQQSDFVFKYALYQQELRKGKTKDEAIGLAREVFISYDVPSNRSLQFVNDIGLWMFTKFILRIQRVLVRYLKEKPGKLIAEHVVSAEIFGNPSLLGMNLLNSFNGSNPLRNPTGGVLTMYEHALPVQLISSILK